MSLYELYPEWNRDPISTLIEMSNLGDIESIDMLLSQYDNINSEVWNMIAHIGAKNGDISLIRYIVRRYAINIEEIVSIALRFGHTNIYREFL